MAVNLTTVANLCSGIMNAARASYGTVDDQLHFSQEFTDGAAAADQAVIAAILDTPNHRRRAEFIELKTVTDGSIVPGSIGAVWIDGKPGVLVKPSTLRRYKLNRFALTSIDSGGYYYLEGQTIYFIGSSAKIESVKTLDSSLLHAPDEYLWAVVAGTLALIFPKEGTNIGAASYFGGQFQNMLQMIRNGATSLPAVTPLGQKV